MKTCCCALCDKPLTPKVYKHSRTYLGAPLCFPHQRMVVESKVSSYAKKLFFALKAEKLPVVLEYQTDTGIIDIAIPGKLYLEIDNIRHSDPDKAWAELCRDSRTSNNQVATLRIPDSLIRDDFRFGKAVVDLTRLYEDLEKAG